ncbi:SNF2-related protein [Methylomarinum vadi]|uniref:SNF2-related protein n=1 Tax=Methylomarinum vadi TaxID=438855 RepID=UPI001F41F129|nr:SNF2-related protein [Methylomarinum vadi]
MDELYQTSSNHFITSVPEPGQLVEVRRRQWVVSDVQGQSFEANGEQHVVTLSSLDEDALGEELQVVWQIEPGAQVLEKAGMPRITGIDSEDKSDAFLDAVRWGAVTNADRSFLQAPFRSGITIEDYQLDPLVRAIDMARVNLLIADDVGLGKTIEAGLVVQELLVRHRARTVFIVCPASLQVKWQVEMWEKFGLEFRIVDTDYIKRLRRERGIHANPWTSFPRLITSMDWMKSGEGLRLVKDCLPPTITYPRKFDILIIDEAHNVAPSTASKYALESQRIG